MCTAVDEFIGSHEQEIWRRPLLRFIDGAKTVRQSLVVISVTLLCMLLALGQPASRARVDQLPRIIIWSWEHDDDLRWIDPRKAAVAYFAGTISLRQHIALFKARRNRLSILENTTSFPVFRVETVCKQTVPTEAAITSAVDAIIAHSNFNRCREIQIDFDATTSERKVYLDMLRQLRQRVPSDCTVSITALASWCLDDKWLQKAPVDETVAMLFCMGAGRKQALSALKREHLDSGCECKQSLGIAICETDTNAQLRQSGCMQRCEHLYAFSPLGWTKRRYEQLLAEVNPQ